MSHDRVSNRTPRVWKSSQERSTLGSISCHRVQDDSLVSVHKYTIKFVKPEKDPTSNVMEEITSLGQTVICEEIFDESSHPSVAEIRDYAFKIGIDPESEPQLLPLAAEGLMKPLPPGWKPCYDDKRKAYYYHNSITGRTQWEHPLDNIYRGLVVKARTESQSLSVGEPTEDATYTRDDLPSYEEPPPLPQFGQPRKDVKLSPLKTRPTLGELNSKFNPEGGDVNPKMEARLSKQKSEERPSTATTGRKVNLSLFSSFDEKNSRFDEHPRKMDRQQELTLSGGGSMFLKMNTKKQPDLTPSPTQKLETQMQLRSILRENSKSMDIDKLACTDKVEREEDDKKSVRFNMEANPDVLFTFSDESETESESKNGKNKVEDIINVKITSNRPQMLSRFTIFPVQQDIDKADVIETNFNEGLEDKIMRNLKLVKPDPSDFIKPELVSEPKLIPFVSTDSEDDSEANIKENLNDNVGSIKTPKFAQIQINIDAPDDTQKIGNKESLIKQQTALEQINSEIETIKVSLAKEAEQELQKFRDELYKSQKVEMEKVLVAEKTKHEGTIKQELESLRKEMENRLSGTLNQEGLKLESQLEKQKSDLQEHFEAEERKWEQILLEKFDAKKQELEKKYNEKLAQMERELEEKLQKTRDELIVSHNAILDQIRQNHAAIIDELQKDYKAEEDIIRREHQKQISELKNKVTREVDIEKTRTKDAEEERLYEKVRCEKRLLEDKYRCLKDKYLKLKTEVKLSIEKRNRKREQNLTTTTTTTTGSETERSPTGKKDRTPIHSPSSNRKHSPKHARSAHDLHKHKPKLDHKIRQILIQDQDTSASDRSYKQDDRFNRNDSQREYDSSDLDINPGRNRKKLFSRLKSSSASRVNNNMKSKESQRSCSPVENLRKQLQKLEDLEDQFPQNAQADTYHLRYPFSDGQKFEGSSELEFFRHRIHLERDSIRRAKESLRKQKTNFKQRQNELKLKHGPTARHTLQQLYQEEKELTDMEVSLHRTRSLLGEKVIRLRHLEQSLQRATVTSDQQQKQEDATLSDLSSHSASSGISSTEFGDSPGLRGAQFKESSEIIQSLENLNSEIREIWDVLNKQHQASNVATVLPPLPLLYPDLGWPLLAGTAPVPPSIPTLADRLQNYRQHIALANAQSTMVTHDTQGATTTLVEKTRNLRQWLRQTTVDTAVDGATPQATL